MVVFFFVSVFRKDENEIDEDEDDNEQINKWKDSKEVQSNESSNKISLNDLKLTQFEVEDFQMKQSKRKKAKKLIKDIFINIFLLYVLFSVCYSIRDENAYSYASHLKSNFKEYKEVSFF